MGRSYCGLRVRFPFPGRHYTYWELRDSTEVKEGLTALTPAGIRYSLSLFDGA